MDWNHILDLDLIMMVSTHSLTADSGVGFFLVGMESWITPCHNALKTARCKTWQGSKSREQWNELVMKLNFIGAWYFASYLSDFGESNGKKLNQVATY